MIGSLLPKILTKEKRMSTRSGKILSTVRLKEGKRLLEQRNGPKRKIKYSSTLLKTNCNPLMMLQSS